MNPKKEILWSLWVTSISIGKTEERNVCCAMIARLFAAGPARLDTDFPKCTGH